MNHNIIESLANSDGIVDYDIIDEPNMIVLTSRTPQGIYQLTVQPVGNELHYNKRRYGFVNTIETGILYMEAA